MTYLRLFTVSAALSAALLSSACLSLLPNATQAPSIYKLSNNAQFSGQGSLDANVKGPTVRIALPNAPKSLQGTDIVVSPDGQRIAYAAGAQWAEAIPRLVQSATLLKLNSHAGVMAIKPPTAARADYAIELDVWSFEAHFDQGEKNAPLAQVKINATLMDLKTRRVIASREFYAESRAGARRVSKIVEAQDLAIQTVMVQLSEWTQMHIGNNSRS